MRGLRGLGALALVAVLGLVGCSPDVFVEPDVTVSGDAGQAPTLTYVTPLTIDSVHREEIWPGTGPEVVPGEPVLIDYWLEDTSDAALVTETYSSHPVSRILSAEELGPDLYDTIVGEQVGARLLQLAPADAGDPTSYATATVVDILPTVAEGEPVTPRDDLPTISMGDEGPTMTPTGEAPPTDLVVQALIRGTGAQVTENDTITVQYTGFSWETGEAFDTTWSTGLPVSFALQDVPPWAEGLVDQPVGSRVMLVVPPTYPLGVTQSEELEGQTVVFVVDILDTRLPEGTDS